MKIVKITLDNINLVKEFTKNELSEHFRYFRNRKIEESIKNHIYTIVGKIGEGVEETIISYGHIDYDINSNKYWLGICILEKYQNKGYGKIIMTELLKYALNQNIKKINLSVDNNNIIAIKLYEKFNFQIESKTDTITYMYNIISEKINETIITLPVSYGEAFDKLSILEIKLEKIKDNNKKIEVELEYDLIKNKLLSLMNTTIRYYYKILKDINLNIWIKQDTFREINIDSEKNILCNEIILDNDRRFRVKNKINNYLNSNLKEQKGYQDKKCFLLTHMGLGDMFTCNGMIRYLSTIYDTVTVVIKKQYLQNITEMFSDDKTINFYEVETDKDISIIYGADPRKLINIAQDKYVILCGTHKTLLKEELENIPFCFYKHANTPYNVFWDYFFIPNVKDSTILHDTLQNNNICEYIVIHNITSNGLCFTNEQIINKFNINKDETLIINFCESIYEKNHKFYDISQLFVFKPLIHYKKIIENANLIILTDSSILSMSLNLDIKTTEKYYISRNNVSYDYIYNTKYRLNNNDIKINNKFKQIIL
jgi:RimJ/RimL family protein N-acetyltransferase